MPPPTPISSLSSGIHSVETGKLMRRKERADDSAAGSALMLIKDDSPDDEGGVDGAGAGADVERSSENGAMVESESTAPREDSVLLVNGLGVISDKVDDEGADDENSPGPWFQRYPLVANNDEDDGEDENSDDDCCPSVAGGVAKLIVVDAVEFAGCVARAASIEYDRRQANVWSRVCPDSRSRVLISPLTP